MTKSPKKQAWEEALAPHHQAVRDARARLDSLFSGVMPRDFWPKYDKALEDTRVAEEKRVAEYRRLSAEAHAKKSPSGR